LHVRFVAAVGRHAESGRTVAEYSKKMKFAQSGNLSKLCERDIPDKMLMEVVSCLYER